MSGKGSQRRPERDPGSYEAGWERIWGEWERQQEEKRPVPEPPEGEREEIGYVRVKRRDEG